MSNNVTGMNEVLRLIEELGKAPQKVLTKATRLSANIVKDAARSNSPSLSGALKRGIKIKKERGKNGKSVYRIGHFGKDFKGTEYVKISARTGKRSYYPSSQEYGWTSRGKRYPGDPHLRAAFDSNRQRVNDNILDVLTTELNSIR
jgi:hypothetical protein